MFILWASEGGRKGTSAALLSMLPSSLITSLLPFPASRSLAVFRVVIFPPFIYSPPLVSASIPLSVPSQHLDYLFHIIDRLMTSRQSWTHLLVVSGSWPGVLWSLILSLLSLALSLPSARPFFPTVPPSISQPSEDSLFILRPLAASSFKISPSPAFSQLIDFLFNGFSGPISFSPLFPPTHHFCLASCPMTLFFFLHHSDGQITILITFLHTHAHIWLRNNTGRHACKPLRIIGHLHHPLLCL